MQAVAIGALRPGVRRAPRAEGPPRHDARRPVILAAAGHPRPVLVDGDQRLRHRVRGGRRDRAPDRGLHLLEDWTTTGSSPRTGTFPQRWAALPLLRRDLKFPTLDQAAWRISDVWEMGFRWFYDLGNDLAGMLRAGRRMIALFGVGDRRARVPAGPAGSTATRGALLAVGLFAFCPTHARERRPDHERHDGHLHVPGGGDRVLGDGAPADARPVPRLFGLGARAALRRQVLRPADRAHVRDPLRRPGRRGRHARGGLAASPRRIAGRREDRPLARRRHRSPPAPSPSASSGPRTGSGTPMFRHFEPNRVRSLVGWDVLEDQGGPLVPVFRFARAHELLPESYIYGFAHTYRFSRYRKAFLNGDYRSTGWVAVLPLHDRREDADRPLRPAGARGPAAPPRRRGAREWRERLYAWAPLLVALRGLLGVRPHEPPQHRPPPHHPRLPGPLRDGRRRRVPGSRGRCAGPAPCVAGARRVVRRRVRVDPAALPRLLQRVRRAARRLEARRRQLPRLGPGPAGVQSLARRAPARRARVHLLLRLRATSCTTGSGHARRRRQLRREERQEERRPSSRGASGSSASTPVPAGLHRGAGALGPPSRRPGTASSSRT